MADDRMKAMRYDNPEYIPVGVSLLPATWMKYREELDELATRHPVIFGQHNKGQRDYDAVGGTYVKGNHTDRWGSVWSNVAEGMEAIVKYFPVPKREDVHKMKAPDIIDGSFPHGFMYLELQYLRSFEELMVDFAEEPPELQMLIDIVLNYNMKNLEFRLKDYNGTMIHFGDDLGMQDRLPMSPEKWRKYLKPCFARIYGRCHEEGLYVYMHTDGHIVEIIPDLVDCGVNVLNPQIRANGLDGLEATCKGKVCINLDLDRQLFPFATPEQIDEHIGECVERLALPEGGLWLSAECAPDVPLENIEAICVALEKHRSYFH
ncbi:hypothetical protein GF312_21440 [Candidatus Poribacteria bacterium]|nr:hypothetical protein [Candidatus Poribacteria bacterium]